MENMFSIEYLKATQNIAYENLDIPYNKFTFIVGESGAGKSTLLKLLNRSVLPASGEVFYKGQNIKDCDALEYRKEVLLATQDVFLFDETIEENFKIYSSLRGDGDANIGNIKECLEICCADLPLDSPCQNLSGGERQRVFLAICLSFKPEVLLLDEPTSAMDEKTSVKVLSNIKAYCATHKVTPMAVCHTLSLVEQFSENTITLYKCVDVNAPTE